MQEQCCLQNRYHSLAVEDADLKGDQDCLVTVPETSDPAAHAETNGQAHISNLATAGEHELLCVEGKINGRRARMLIDSGSTHDFIAENFARRHNLSTETESENLCVTLADGSTSSQPMVTTDTLKVVVRGLQRDATLHHVPTGTL